MEKLTFTRFERDMELALFRLQQMLQIQVTDGREAALSLVQPDDPESTFPGDIPVENLPIYEKLNRLEQYAYQEIWEPSVYSDCTEFGIFFQSIAHPETIEDWKYEASFDNSVYMEDGDNTHYHAFGNHYLGILEDIFTRATARYKLDQNYHLTLREVAYLAELNERSVMNAVHLKGAGQLRTDGKDKRGRALVDAVIAREWLSHKEKFVPTRNLPNDEPGTVIAQSTKPTEWIFVPVAKDGTRFLPELKTQSGFRIGKKGAEQTVSDYFEALQFLTDMEQPYWRRKNAAGNAGIVAGVSWIKMARRDLLETQSN